MKGSGAAGWRARVPRARAQHVLVAVALALLLAGTLLALLVGHWPLVALGGTTTVVVWFVLTLGPAGRGDGGSRRR